MKRFLAAVTAVFFLLPLSSCANPTPNEVLSQLYAAADEPHKQLLYDEVIRLCGHHKDGTVPESCNPEVPDTLAPGSAGVLEVIANVPEESLPLVVDVYLDYIAAEATPSPIPTVGNFVESLEMEYGFEYALGIARAYGDDEVDALVDNLAAEHAAIVEKLEEATANTAAPTETEAAETTSAAATSAVREPAYQFNHPEPTDSASARSFITALHQDLVAFHVHTAQTTTTPDWRETALTVAGRASLAGKQLA